MPSSLPTPERSAGGAPGILYVVGTPIGHREDITLRALKTLAAVDRIAAEDTRETAKLLQMHDIRTPLLSYAEHNEAQRALQLIDALLGGANIALVSDAGTPGISDPGYRLVRLAAARGIRVVPIPGPSALTAALSSAGLPTDSFIFIGFAARRGEKRRRQLEALADQGRTLIFYESPRRLLSLLEDLRAILGERPAVLARELTKLHEELLRGSLSEILATLAGRESVRGECTLLVGGADERDQPADLCSLEGQLRLALDRPGAHLNEVVRQVAAQAGLPRRDVYAAALAIRDPRKDAGRRSR
jgi:16S rRNA (cytidine1402-2'-O)-methyltransferase